MDSVLEELRDILTATGMCRIRKNGTAVSLSRHAVSLQRNAQ